MTEEKETEEEQHQTYLANRVLYSLRGAAGEILGDNYDAFMKYFKIHAGTVDGHDAIIVVEEATSTGYQVPIVYKYIKDDSDREYYSPLRELAKLVAPNIPDEAKNFPKNEWPEPKWQPPKEKEKED